MRVQVGGGGHLDGGGADNHRLIIAKDGLVPLLQRAVSRERRARRGFFCWDWIRGDAKGYLHRVPGVPVQSLYEWIGIRLGKVISATNRRGEASS